MFRCGPLCLYVYIRMYAYICMYGCMCGYTWICICMYVPTYVSVYIYVRGSIRVRVSIIASYLFAYFKYTSSRFIYVHMYMFICTYIYIYIYIYVYICLYMCVRARMDTHGYRFYVPALALQATMHSFTRQKGRKDSDGRVQDVW